MQIECNANKVSPPSSISVDMYINGWKDKKSALCYAMKYHARQCKLGKEYIKSRSNVPVYWKMLDDAGYAFCVGSRCIAR